MASLFGACNLCPVSTNYKIDVPEITPGPPTRGRATGPAHLWRRRRFAERRRAHPLHHCGDGVRAELFEEAHASPPQRVAISSTARINRHFAAPRTRTSLC